MSHSLNSMWVHVVWATKYRNPLLAGEVEKKVYRFMYHQFWDMKIRIGIINGMPDHVHCLFLLSRTKTMAQIIKQVKGSSSRYINKNKLTKTHFSWQAGYAVFAVPENRYPNVHQYITLQKEHHRAVSFKKELAVLSKS